MGKAEEAIEESGLEAAKALKKIIASKGGLQGNFYYAGDATGKTAGLIITLTSKDPKGSKAATKGKALRKELPGAKFGRGTVIMKGPKLMFALQSGSTSGGQMKNGFKKSFANDKLKALKSFLRKAVISAPESEELAGDDPTDVDADALFADMTTAEKAELLELQKEQGSLAARNAELQASFLSADEAESDQLEIVEALQGTVFKLEAATPVDEDALQDARLALAAADHTGPSLPGVNMPVPDDVRPLLEATSTALEHAPVPDPVSWASAVSTYRDAIDTVQSQLEELRKVLAASGDDDLIQIGEQGLPRLTANKRTKLEAALMEARMTTGDKSAAARERAGALAEDFAAQLTSNLAAAATDNNPYGVTVTLQSTLGTALRSLAVSAKG